MPHEPSPAPVPSDAPAAPSPGFARLALAISSWTTRAILSLAVLVAGVAFGRQVLLWWAEGAAEPEVLAPQIADSGLGELDAPHEFEFGDGRWAMSQQAFEGSRDEALATVRAICRQLAPSAPVPQDSPRPAELQLLARLAGQEPVEQQPGAWRMYELKKPIPMVVATRPNVATGPEDSGNSVAVPPARVVTWGLAVPQGPSNWSLLAFHPVSSSPARWANLPEVPFPPGSRKVFSMRTASGEAIASFRGPGDVEAWKRFYDDWASRNAWTTPAPWTLIGGAWRLRLRSAGEPATTVDLRIGPDDRGQLSGQMMVGR